jgi:hypothetical protein
MPQSTQEDIQHKIASYNTLALAYEDLFNKTIPLYAQAREDELMAVRDELIGTGFPRYFPEYLQNADNKALEALDQYEAGDYYQARETTAEAMNEYDTLLTGAKVFQARQEVVDRGFITYDSDNFDRADDVAQTAIEAYEAGDKETALASAEEALLRYNIVLSNGWTAYSGEKRTFSTAERENALTEKANIASRELFREAEALYNQAEQNFASEQFQEAANLYMDAESLFIIARQDTEEKRQRALETIRLAEEKIEESSETATEAERIIEGGSR